MKNFVMSEKTYAEYLLSGGDHNKDPYFAANTLAKYYKSLGYKKAQIETEVNRFLTERTGYPSSKIKSITDDAINAAYEYPLYEIKEIVVTKPEIEKIKSLHSTAVKDYRLHRFAFSLLCFSKYFALRGKKKGWINAKWSDIFTAAHLPGLNNERKKVLIKELIRSEFLNVPYIGNKKECVQVLFSKDGDPEVIVDNINEVGFIYEEYADEKRFIKCQRCGKRVLVTNGRAKLCKPCGSIVDREKAKERKKAKSEQPVEAKKN